VKGKVFLAAQGRMLCAIVFAVIGVQAVQAQNLPAPTLTARAASATDIALSWTPVSGAAGYIIFQSQNQSTGFQFLGNELTTSATNNNLPPNVTLYYRVAAYSANGTFGASSNVASASTAGGAGQSPASVQTFNSISDFKKWLSGRPANTVSTAYNVKLNVNNLGGAYNNAASAGNVLYTNKNKYVNLDLSGSNLSTIGEQAFQECVSLVSVTLPNKVTVMGIMAFYGCTNLTSITLPNSVTGIGESTFINTGLTRVTFLGSIPVRNFLDGFSGDLANKFYAADKANGTPGTYTRPNSGSNTWTKQ